MTQRLRIILNTCNVPKLVMRMYIITGESVTNSLAKTEACADFETAKKGGNKNADAQIKKLCGNPG